MTFCAKYAIITTMNEQEKLISYLELADKFKAQKDYKSAIGCYENFIKIDPTKSVIYNLTADLYNKAYGDDSLEKQIELYENAYKLQPDNRLTLHGLAFSYEKIGNAQKAQEFYRELLHNKPTETDFYNYGAFLIHNGDFVNGHKFFAHRFLTNDQNLKYPADVSKKWDFKSDLAGKTLLIHNEQGFGDTIMYSRFVPFFKNIAKDVIFVVQKELFNLISQSAIFQGIKVATDDDDLKYDYNMALLDCPYVIKTNSQNLPYSDKYLDVSDNLVSSYAQKYLKTDKKYRIGLSCHGDMNANYNARNIDISKLINFEDYSDVQFYNLQKDDDIRSNSVTALGDTFKDFTYSACAVKNMDMVITTDNVILNLAGALGVKTVALFNKQTNYRWFKLNGEDVGWYKSVKPLQAKKQNDFTQLALDLSEYLKTTL